MYKFVVQPGCVNTTELDPRKLSRINALKAKRLRQAQELILQHNLKVKKHINPLNAADVYIRQFYRFLIAFKVCILYLSRY
jgi:hypothetical protein